ncbi:MAG: UDP-galactopyranose mutase [Elusimicrobiales bacterium]
MKIKYIIVGCGFSGSVIAERIANELKEKVLILEKRAHIGGNCYDYKDSNGIIIHKYGPHLFHTDYKEVYEYLSKFTDWIEYEHRVMAYVDGQTIPLPFNFNSIDKVYSKAKADILKDKLIRMYGKGKRVGILELMRSSDLDIKELSKYIYDKIFVNYTAKQWGKKPEEINITVTSRVPVVIDYDNRYFQDRYQYIPNKGYTEIFKRMLNNGLIDIKLKTDFKQALRLDFESGEIYLYGEKFVGKVIFTGMIDELCGFRYGILPYRSLKFKLKTVNKEQFQETAVVNYPNDYKYTRITEYKHIHKTRSEKTAIMYEYPCEYKKGGMPFYPIFTEEAQKMYQRYRELINKFDNIILLGRLAEYRYYDMDDVIKRALETYERIKI